MERRHKKVRIVDLAAKEVENKFRLPRSRISQRATAAMEPDFLSSEPIESPIVSPPFIIVSEPLPLFSEDEKYMGDLVDGIYQCFELTNGVYVSHFTCDTYGQLKNHIFFVHT